MKKIIAIDFDGTIIKYDKDAYKKTDLDYEFMPNAEEVIAWINKHFYTILWTSRCGSGLQYALKFLDRNGIYFDSILENAPFLDFDTSNKIYADVYIDDHGLVEINWLKIQNFLRNKFLDNVEIIVTNVIEGQ
jgi:hypothetical protein